MPGMLGDNTRLLEIIKGPVADLLEKLNGDDGARWEYALKKFLRKEPAPWELTDLPFEVWLTDCGVRRFLYDLVIVKIADLGFSGTVSAREVNMRAKIYNLEVPRLDDHYYGHPPAGTQFAKDSFYTKIAYRSSQKLIFRKYQ